MDFSSACAFTWPALKLSRRAQYDDGPLGAQEDEISRFRDIWENRREIRSFRR
jgi:hypothetical protein